MRIVLMGEFSIVDYVDKLEFRRKITNTNRVNRNLAKGLSELPGTEVHFIIFFHDIAKDTIIKDGNLTVHFLSVTRLRNLLTGYMYTKHRLQKEIDMIVPDVVIGIGTESIFSYAALKSGYPNIIVIHGIMNTIVKEEGRFVFKHRFFHVLERYVLSKAQHIVAISPYVVQTLGKLTKARFHYVENSVDIECFAQYNSPRDTKSILFVGVIQPIKAVKELVLAVDLLVKKGLELELRIVGPPSAEFRSYYDEVIKLVNTAKLDGVVKFLGYQTPENVRQEMSKCAFLVLPSFVETAPMVISEAMALGTPVIATNIAGVPWMVKDSVTGFLVEPGDINGLAQRMEYLLGNENLRKQMGRAAVKEARERYHPEIAVRKIIQVCEQVLKEV